MVESKEMEERKDSSSVNKAKNLREILDNSLEVSSKRGTGEAT